MQLLLVAYIRQPVATTATTTIAVRLLYQHDNAMQPRTQACYPCSSSVYRRAAQCDVVTYAAPAGLRTQPITPTAAGKGSGLLPLPGYIVPGRSHGPRRLHGDGKNRRRIWTRYYTAIALRSKDTSRALSVCTLCSQVGLGTVLGIAM